LFTDYFWSNGSSIEGRLAVGNSAWVNLFSVGVGLYGTKRSNCPNPDLTSFWAANYAMVVAGGLTMNATTINNGGLAYGYEVDVNCTFSNVEPQCPLTPGANVLDFGKVERQLRLASNQISKMTVGLSKYTVGSSQIVFHLNGSIMTEYFVVKESDLLANTYLVLQGKLKTYKGKTATVIINVVMDESNTDASFTIANWGVSGFDANTAKNILWNFNGYRSLSFQRGLWPGTVLSMDASIENTYGDLYGGVYAKAWNTKKKMTTMQFHMAAFAGEVFTNDCI